MKQPELVIRDNVDYDRITHRTTYTMQFISPEQFNKVMAEWALDEPVKNAWDYFMEHYQE